MLLKLIQFFLSEFKLAFSVYDRSGSGRINQKQMTELCRSLGHNITATDKDVIDTEFKLGGKSFKFVRCLQLRPWWRERNKFSPPLFRLFCRTPFRALLHFTPETLRLNAHQRCNPCQRMRCTFNQRVRKCKQSVLCEVFLKRHNSYCAGTVMPTRSNTLQG